MIFDTYNGFVYINSILHCFIFPVKCYKGERPLSETKRCQLNGYTCTNSDSEACCSGRQPETRSCVPCDETKFKKTKGQRYTTEGTCDIASYGNCCIVFSFPAGHIIPIG